MHARTGKARCPLARRDAPPTRTFREYIACIREGRFDDALRVIRNDNPLPTVCGYVCEHPCESACRRALEDAAVNICGLKRFAADSAANGRRRPPLFPTPARRRPSWEAVPPGWTAAYYLRPTGHAVTVYDQREKLGGMARYGIPDYRLPQEQARRRRGLHP